MNTDLNEHSFQKYKQGNWNVHILDRCTSTFDIAKQLIEKGSVHGTLIVSDVQTGGKGRQSRKWFSPSGGLWMSIILKPNIEISKIASITLLCAVAVAMAIEEISPEIVPAIKWSNDIFLNDKKLCGILTETVLQASKAQYVIVGIGINANNATDTFDRDIKQTSISFNDIGIYINRAQMATKINDNLIELVTEYESNSSLDFILEYYINHMQWLNQMAVMKNTITGEIAHQGIIRGIDSAGHLLLETTEGIKEILSGELSLRSI